ncbi:MAG: glycosyltransferase family 2 protein [Deltaproteobacteria bacterium]|nr:glycosyltransferase family 2 protein [Deltaproteobacteria bacterium]
MYRNHKIALVIPAYNEEKLIGPTLRSVSPEIDQIYVVDDCSTDKQNEVIQEIAKADRRVTLIRHEFNQGPGGGIITGYRKASQDGCDIALVVGGDHQMNLQEARNFLDPIIEGVADYTKGNRFVLSKLEETIAKMPRIRLFANWIITALTKIASGYFGVMDVVDGYTAIHKRVIDTISWEKAWKGYGYPMDFLVRLNAYGFRVLDVPRTAIYLVGERQSQIKGIRYAMTVAPMLFRAFLWRLRFKYVYLDFHPLVLFYYVSFLLVPLGLCMGTYLVFDRLFLGGFGVTASRSILVALILTTGFQFFLFAMYFDREESKAWSHWWRTYYLGGKKRETDLVSDQTVSGAVCEK